MKRTLLGLAVACGLVAVLSAQEPARFERGIDVLRGNVTLGTGDLVLSAGSISQTTGDLTLTAGDLLLSAGDVDIGTSGTPRAHTSESAHALEVHTTQSSTSAGTSYEPALFSTTLTGAGQVGGRVRAFMTTNVALGAWSNALKAEVTYGASGSTTGLGSALVAEMTLSAGTTSGTYAPLEIELNLGSGASTGTESSLAYFSVNGADIATFQGAGYLFSVNGLGAATTGELFQANTATAASHALRISIGGVDYFIMLTDTGA
jgi:hypothetical protein